MTPKEELIRATFKEVSPISDRTFHQISLLFEYQLIPKMEDFIQRDRPNAYEYIILEGISRSYLINQEGNEITISFFQAPSVLSPHISRTSKGVSLLNFQAISDLEVVYFREESLVELMIENLEIRSFANTVLRNELIRKVNKEIGLASLTAKERLIRFREEFDGLENRIPHSMIASYLGITNISLSRLRRSLIGS